jgi:hypothetical protein
MFRTRHYSVRTEQVYVNWAKRFILLHRKRHPNPMRKPKIAQYLTYLATFAEALRSMKGHVKNKFQSWLAMDSFLDSLPLLRRELPLSPSYAQLFSLRAAAVVPLGSPGYFSFRVLPQVVRPETVSLLWFAWLADWVAVCQPGFY